MKKVLIFLALIVSPILGFSQYTECTITGYEGSVYVSDFIEFKGKLYCVSKQGVFKSDDGDTWEFLVEGQYDRLGATEDFLLASKSNEYGNGNGIYKSTDLGLSWEDLGVNNEIYSITTEGNRIILGTDDYIHISEDGGETWTKSTNEYGAEIGYVKNIEGEKYIAIGFTSSSNRIYLKSDDNMNSWHQFSVLKQPIDDKIYSRFYKIMVHNNAVTMTGNESICYYSVDEGETFEYFDIGLLRDIEFKNGIYYASCLGPEKDQFVPQMSLSLDTCVNWYSVEYDRDFYDFILFNGYAIASDHKSIYKIPMHGLSTNDVNYPLKDISIFPNPSNEILHYQFTVIHKEYVNIYMTDILGNKIKNIVDKVFYDGRHKAVIDISDLQKSIYLINFSVGKNTISKKIVIR